MGEGPEGISPPRTLEATGAEPGYNPLAANIAGDALGLPGSLGTHFTSERFALSAVPDILAHVGENYAVGDRLRVLSLCGGDAFYERTVCGALQQQGYLPELTVIDLQRASLESIREERFPTTTIEHSVTELPLGSSGTDESGEVAPATLVLSRAFEHYLSDDDLAAALYETARVMRPRELYVPQITSGDPKTLGALTAAVKAIAGKDVTYLSLEQYQSTVDRIRNHDGSPAFSIRGTGQAETQTDRGVLVQARRYLNERFLEMHSSRLPDEVRGVFKAEIEDLLGLKTALEKDLQAGRYDRHYATQWLDGQINNSRVYQQLFRGVYIEALSSYFTSLDSPPERGTTVLTDTDGHIQDVLLDIEYPLTVLERQAPARL